MKDQLKQECQSVKEQQIPIKVAPSKGKNGPFPMQIQVQIAQPPEASHYDIYEIHVIFNIQQFDPPVLSIQIPQEKNAFSSSLTKQVQHLVSEHWRELFSKEKSKWHLLDICLWMQKSFTRLLSSVPGCIEMYMGTGPNGESMRRYALIPVDPTDESESDSEEESNQDDNEEAREYWRRKKEEELAELEREKAEEARLKREEAEFDPSVVNKRIQVSKKEQEAQKAAKDKQGVRMRKTASRRKKFVPPSD